MIGEFDLIARYFAPLATAPGALHLTDDAALLAPPPGRELVLTADAIVAGVHFFPHDPPGDIAKKLLRVNLSDLAGKGAIPLGYLMTCAWPNSVDERFIADFAAGLAEDQATFGLSLLGGDTTRTPGPIALSLTALGHVAPGSMPRRGGGRPGDRVFVSGTIGDAALGLKVRQGEFTQLSMAARDFLDRRYRLPEPRLSLGQTLVREGLATASLDVSDGLLADLGHICEVSGLAAEIESARIPLSAAAQEALADDPELLALVMAGGDDYELCFTVAPERVDSLAGLPVTEIGYLKPGEPTVCVRDREGVALTFDRQGWTHF